MQYEPPAADADADADADAAITVTRDNSSHRRESLFNNAATVFNAAFASSQNKPQQMDLVGSREMAKKEEEKSGNAIELSVRESSASGDVVHDHGAKSVSILMRGETASEQNTSAGQFSQPSDVRGGAITRAAGARATASQEESQAVNPLDEPEEVAEEANLASTDSGRFNAGNFPPVWLAGATS